MLEGVQGVVVDENADGSLHGKQVRGVFDGVVEAMAAVQFQVAGPWVAGPVLISSNMAWPSARWA